MSEFLKLMDRLSGEKKEKLQKLFTNAPYWLIDSFQVINLEKNTTFVTSFPKTAFQWASCAHT